MPVSKPTRAKRWWPSASISATRSPARVPASYPSWGLSDSPIPRWSTATTWKSRASAGITMRHWYQVWGQPCTSSRGGPSPPVTACRRSSPVSTYRLVNVSVNPSASCGAPETEPGPSGVGSRVENALMRIPSHRPDELRAESWSGRRRQDRSGSRQPRGPRPPRSRGVPAGRTGSGLVWALTPLASRARRPRRLPGSARRHGGSAPDLCDEVGLIDDSSGLAATDADEDALVEPVEIGRAGLDLG